MDSDKRHILLICNTPFQVMVGWHVIMLYYRNAVVDFVVSNQFKEGEKVAQNATSSKLCRRVFFINNPKKPRKQNGVLGQLKYYYLLVKAVICALKNSKKIAQYQYDEVLFTNISLFSKILISLLWKQNKETRFHIYEEGIGTYSKVYADSDNAESLFRKYVDKTGIFQKTDSLFLFHPSFLQWHFPKEKIRQLPSFNEHDTRYMNIVNALFDYAHCEDTYDRKIIFFEESYLAEHEDVPDIEIVNKMAELVGKENLMIKIHPRNPQNRFEKLGYKTNYNTSIPWELIMLNQSMNERILVTIASGAVINPYLYIGQKIRNYSLLKCLSKRPGIMNSELGDLMQKVYDAYPDILIAPESFDDFYKKLKADIQAI